jgi:hypothetical protein
MFIRGITLTVLMVVLTVPIWLPSNHSSFDKRVWALEPRLLSLLSRLLYKRPQFLSGSLILRYKSFFDAELLLVQKRVPLGHFPYDVPVMVHS